MWNVILFFVVLLFPQTWWKYMTLKTKHGTRRKQITNRYSKQQFCKLNIRISFNQQIVFKIFMFCLKST